MPQALGHVAEERQSLVQREQLVRPARQLRQLDEPKGDDDAANSVTAGQDVCPPQELPSTIIAFATSMVAVAAFVEPHRPPRSTPSYVLTRVSTADGRRPPSSFTAASSSRSSVSTASTSPRISSLTPGSLYPALWRPQCGYVARL
eukprot:6205081-Pleurochrysis_carterae.AAC.1